MDSDTSIHLAVDLGAGSGRVIAGINEGGRLRLEVVNRFPNPAIEVDGGLQWGLDDLWKEIRAGLEQAAGQFGSERIRSIGVDTWGVDYVLLDARHERLAPATHYRDPRTGNAMEEVFAKVPKEEVFRRTGIQFLPLNTLYQLHAEQRDRPELLARASRFLLMPDYLNLLLSGEAVCERTNASTTQLLSPRGDWDPALFEAIGVDPSIAPPLVDPGTVLGTLLPAVAEETGLDPATKVIAVGSHDTASAVAAVPAEPGTRFAYLSSGSWSLLGAELADPVVNDEVLAANFTNEGGVFDTIRFLKNINGLYLIQECRRIWAEQGDEYSFGEMAEMSAAAKPFTAFIDPDHADFGGRGDMPELVRGFCWRSGQPVPQDPGTVLRIISDSLALKYRWVFETLQRLVDREFDLLHVIGGGGQNEALDQAIADSLGVPVVVGPYEATAYGNVLLQMIASGGLESLAAGRALLRESEPLKTFEPGERAPWDEAYSRFVKLLD